MSPALHEFLTIWLLQGCFLFGITVEGHLFLCIHYSVSQSPWSSISASTIVYFCEDLGDQPYRFALLTAWFILKRTTKPISYAFLLYYYRKILFNSGSGTHDSYLLFYLSTEFFLANTCICFWGMNEQLNTDYNLMSWWTRHIIVVPFLDE
jgi:hypothetical protein